MSSSTSADRRGRRRKFAAVLAGGLVVGVGTMATLASWSDPEYASGAFTAGKFVVQGSADQTTFSEHATLGTAASLVFTAPVTALSPGDTVYAPYALRLDNTTTNGATVVVAAGTSTGTVSNVTYTLFTTAAAGCTAASTAVTTVVANGTTLGTVGTPVTFSLTKPVLPAAGAITYLCFKVTAGAGLTQGQTGTASWVFTATSN
jgi:predicted ribosomally synthesized peptide with SipW-like signal peptide